MWWAGRIISWISLSKPWISLKGLWIWLYSSLLCVCTYISEWVMMTNCWLIALLATFMFKQLLKCIPLSLPAHLSSRHIMTHHDTWWHWPMRCLQSFPSLLTLSLTLFPQNSITTMTRHDIVWCIANQIAPFLQAHLPNNSH